MNITHNEHLGRELRIYGGEHVDGNESEFEFRGERVGGRGVKARIYTPEKPG